jgi:succinate dehydrogenase/fumarate reductase flavoprotein subunit
MNDEKNRQQAQEVGLSRRSFLKGAGILGAGAAAATITGCTTSDAPGGGGNKDEITWDREAEIVIIGYGGSGAVTAIQAIDAGATVLVIEKQKQDVEGQPWNQTNSTRICYSAIMDFNSEAEAVTYLKAVSMGRTPDDVVASWARYATKTADWLQEMGGEIVDAGCSTEYPEDILPEAFNTYHQWAFPGQGPELWSVLDNACKERNVEVIFETPGKSLVTNEAGEVIGVIADQGGKEFKVKASKAVVIATGGFEYNDRMLSNFVWGYPSRFYANPDSTGDGIEMAQAVGADLWHMSLIGGRVIPYFPDLGYGLMGGTPQPFILVDKYGKRFMRENWKSHSAVWESFKFSTDLGTFTAIPCFSVFDQTAVDKGPVISATGAMLKTGHYEWSADNSAEIAKGWIYKGETIEDLARAIAADPEVDGRMDPAVLAQTLSTYNGYAAAGADPDFNRGQATLQALSTPPYYALKMYPGGVNTFGGPARNAKSQIIKPDGSPVGRLYGVGEMGSVLGYLYSGGGWNICEIIVSGHLAAEFAIQETAW